MTNYATSLATDFFFLLLGCTSSNKNSKLLSTNTQNTAVIVAKVNAPVDKYLIAKNEKQSFTPASCQKVVTTLFAIKELGKDFSYVTSLGKLKTRKFPAFLKAKTGTMSGISCLCGYLD